MIPYLLNIQEFNPIGDNANEIFFQFEKMMKAKQQEMGWNDEIIKNTVEEVKDKLWPTLLGATAEAGVYGLSCLLLILGAACQVRALMLPYMILQMIVLIVFMLIGIGCTVVAFFFNVIAGTFLHSTNSTSKMISRKMFNIFLGAVAGGVVFILSILLIYFWIAIQRAYIELGNNDYMYSPAPVKPTYNDGRGGYYPTSPQHFQMDERK